VDDGIDRQFAHDGFNMTDHGAVNACAVERLAQR